MVAIIILSVALFTGATSAWDFDQGELAFNGTTNVTTLLQYPSIVQIDFLNIWGWGGWTQNCAGSVLTSRWILTAASCVSGANYPAAYARRIRAGADYRNMGGQIVYVDYEINYQRNVTNGTVIEHDISVVRLSSPLFFSNLIRQGAIIASGFYLPPGLVVNQVGWGQGNSSNALTSERITTVLWDQPINGTLPTILAGLLSSNATNNGDVGGPWFFGNVTVGIIAGLNTNNTWSDYLYATAISPYTSWIVSVAV